MADKYNASRNATRQARVSQGLCRDCGLVPFQTGKVICLVCYEKRATRQALRAAKLKSQKLCVQCQNPTNGKTLCDQCTELAVQGARDRRRTNKLEVIELYGGCCQECGETDIRCLTIDHINNDGNVDCVSNGKRISSVDFYARLVKIARRLDLMLLCFNCHAKKDLAPWWYKED